MEITLTRPDDWHLHLRDGASMRSVVPYSAARFGRAIIMPNLRPPISTVNQALAYRRRILDALPEDSSFSPLMTLYLTDNTRAQEIRDAADSRRIFGAKLYPAGATTNSDEGVTDLERIYPLLEVMAEVDMPLLVHGEVTRETVDIFDRERYFIDEVLAPLTARLPELRVVMEHITTADAVAFVRGNTARLAATITPQHLLYNRSHMFEGGLRPHRYCLPVLKREQHRRSLVQAATSGNPRFFLGTDSAPHRRQAKESECGCAGIFSAHGAIELYAEAFEAAGRLEHLEGFAARFGADFYGLPQNADTITLRREPWRVPDSYPMGDSVVVPLRAGETINWRLVADGDTSG